VDVLKRKMKFLATKLSALQSEVKVSKEIYELASREVDAMFNEKYFPEASIIEERDQNKDLEEYDPENDKETPEEQDLNSKQETPQPEDMPDQISAAKDADPEVKKMFKKIASRCHPDKLQDMDDGFEKVKKEQLYQKARQALENNDVLIMADVANQLGVEIPEITEVQLKQTEQKIISIKKELSMIESTAVWHWFFTEDPTKKDDILKQLFQLMYEQQNSRT
tara:strand:- start:3156 stop:3824 length:669 start_codon:yes stop_codon:yes gene_type:complete